MLMVLPTFWYGFISGMSAPSMYNNILIQVYNVFYTSLPIMVYALFDKEFKGDFLADHPYLYIKG